MATEIERKFLIADGSWRADVVSRIVMRQNYLATRPAVRVRLADDQGYLTIKGKTRNFSRAEYEYPIPAEDAAQMLDTLCSGYEIAKTRYIVPYHGKTWEVDVFDGLNAGLVVAEIELGSEDEEFDRPPWLGREVTGEARYHNGALSRTPWTKQ